MLNVAVVMGRLVADPELRHTPSDVAVTSFTLAVDRLSMLSPAQNVRLISLILSLGAAPRILYANIFRKGQMMAVHGSIQTRTYTR